MRFKDTTKHLDFLRAGYLSMHVGDLTKAFNAHFRMQKNEGDIKSALQNHKIKCGRAPKDRLINRYRLFTDEQVEFLRKEYKGRSVTELRTVFNEEYGTGMTHGQIRTAVHNRGITSGRTGCFEKGHKSWNSGTKGLTSANKTSFKKGSTPPNRKPLGAERICSKDGYILVKVAEYDPHTCFSTRWKHKHVHIWERDHGPVPDGMVVAFRDGDKLNVEPENLMLISRAELLRLNKHGYKDTPPELKPSVFSLAILEVKIFNLGKEQNDTRPKSNV